MKIPQRFMDILIKDKRLYPSVLKICNEYEETLSILNCCFKNDRFTIYLISRG